MLDHAVNKFVWARQVSLLLEMQSMAKANRLQSYWWHCDVGGTSLTCHQNISSPTSVTNIDVVISFWDHFEKSPFWPENIQIGRFHHFMKSELIPIVKRLMRRYLDRMWKITTIDQFKFFSEMMPMMNNQDFGRNIRHLKLLTFGQSVVLTPDLTQSWFFQLNK